MGKVAIKVLTLLAYGVQAVDVTINGETCLPSVRQGFDVARFWPCPSAISSGAAGRLVKHMLHYWPTRCDGML